MEVLHTNILIYFFKGLGNIKQNLLSKPPKDIGETLLTGIKYNGRVLIMSRKSPHAAILILTDVGATTSSPSCIFVTKI
jgi:hypothetical protein